MSWNLFFTYVAMAVFAFIWSFLGIVFFGFNTIGYWVMIVAGGALFGYTADYWPGMKRGMKSWLK
jgi:hypothetical protein